jgi:ribokinase
MRTAVVGHVEWIEFLRVERVPVAGEIVHASERWEEAAGGGAAAAEQLQKLSGDGAFFTAVGSDEVGERAVRDLARGGLRVEASSRPGPTRRGVTHIDATGERTITVVGERLSPHGADPLPWADLAQVDALYFTAGDLAALQAARKARVLVATTRVFGLLVGSGVQLDALVGSSEDSTETCDPGLLDPPPRLVVWTRGKDGGTFIARGEEPRRFPAAPVPAPVVDRYGAGDAFAGALAFGLARDEGAEPALGLAARCGAAVLTGRGPYEGQLGAADI